jgi:5S rRNA maturation endonuclease (ribonuclease M5)
MPIRSDLYKRYRSQIDVRAVLEHYGAENVTETRNADGTTELVHSCLLDRVEPHHANGDAHPSAWANVEKGLYCCAVYWAGDILHLIRKLEGEEDIGGAIASFTTRSEAKVRDELLRIMAQPSYTVEVPSYAEAVLKPWARSHPYVRSRGISQETCERLQIGYDPAANRIVFPHWWNGKLVGWQKRIIPFSRSWPGTTPPYPKYKNSSGFPKSETLYGFDRVADMNHAVVVESPMSLAKAYELGWRSVVATFGAKVSQTQINLLRDFSRVYVWFDDDVPGHRAEYKLVNGLHRHTDVRVVEPDHGRDLGDYNTADAVISKLESAKRAIVWLGGLDGEEEGTRPG